jgi:opacity protein-like surface antigen
LGVAAQLVNTGWLGFGRIDYRDGSNFQGLSATGGIRYQFTPEAVVTNAPGYIKAPLYKAPIAPGATPYYWTGAYIGGFAGAGLGDFHQGFINGLAEPRIAGFIGGGQLGYNYQAGALVYGLEGDGGWTNANGSTACAPLTGNTGVAEVPLFNMTCNARTDWVATLAGRLGYAWDRTLWYVKAGGAWGDETVSITCNLGALNGTPTIPTGQKCANPAGAVTNVINASDTRLGWTVGGGVEFGLSPNWSTKAEFAYVDLGNRNITGSDGTVVNAGLRIAEVKIGLNYRFDPTIALPIFSK